ncbi:MAG: hypothetical protein IKP01_03255, partial [Bacteroidales bacterium]|nr:hypothetical protein [Bacteroidales bacterium]
MKKYILTMAVLALVCGTASAQGILGRLGERAKQAVENNIGNKIEQGINNALDGKKKDRNASSSDQEEDAAAPAEKVDFAEIQAKSDFKRGANVFFEDDLNGERMGEFPSKWDLLEGSEVEVVNVKGAKAIRMEASRIQPLMK